MATMNEPGKRNPGTRSLARQKRDDHEPGRPTRQGGPAQYEPATQKRLPRQTPATDNVPAKPATTTHAPASHDAATHGHGHGREHGNGQEHGHGHGHGSVKQQLARHGEQLAVDYLTSEGMKILDRNWRCRHGEIDIIAEDGPALVVVEVKTRSSRSHGTALESVRPAKLSRLRMLAAQWLTTQPRTFQTVRVDVIALERFAGDYSLRHVRGAI